MFAKKYRTFTTVIIVALALMLPAGSALAAADDAAATVENKSEIVYANLTTSGQVSAAYVVNRFVITSEGTVTDYGNYGSVINLTDTAVLDKNGDKVTFNAKAGNFYYQGNVPSPQLPWLFDITYTLNGVTVSQGELAGASGNLVIHITSKANDAVDNTFTDNYLMQVAITIDSEKASDVESEGATVAIAGTNLQLNHTILPGKDTDITVNALVYDFEMEGISISAVPYAMDITPPDTDEMISDFEKLSDAIADLNAGVGDLADGVKHINAGTKKLADGSSGIQSGLSSLSTNGTQIVSASAQINASLSQISAMLNGNAGSSFSLSDLAALPAGLSQLSQGLSDASTGLKQLKDGFVPAFAALDSAMQGIPSGSLSQAQLTDLYSLTDPSQHGVLDELVANYQAAQTAKGTYDSVKAAFSAIEPTLDTVTGNMDTMAATLSTMSADITAALNAGGMGDLSQLTSGLTTLAQNYGDFHTGLGAYTSGVSSLSTGYSDFHTGLTKFFGGINTLYAGVEKLYDGTQKLNKETSDMPETLQSEIDNMLDDFSGGDFAPVSFTSSNNSGVDLVQFVFKCDNIKKPETAETDTIITAPETVWDRLISLFDKQD